VNWPRSEREQFRTLAPTGSRTVPGQYSKILVLKRKNKEQQLLPLWGGAVSGLHSEGGERWAHSTSLVGLSEDPSGHLPTGDEGGHLDSEEEEAPRPMPHIPEDLECQEAMVKLLELQKLVLPLVCNHEGHDKFPPAAQNRGDEPAPGAPAPQELGAAEEQGDVCEVSLADSVEPA
uniref:Uncharacterized protein n=1 Tax=Papio anubis TaxID=9555 RepID=A0A8I5NSZ0_PAPAN